MKRALFIPLLLLLVTAVIVVTGCGEKSAETWLEDCRQAASEYVQDGNYIHFAEKIDYAFEGQGVEFYAHDLCLDAVPGHENPGEIDALSDKGRKGVESYVHKLHRADVAPIACHELAQDRLLDGQSVGSVPFALYVLRPLYVTFSTRGEG